MNREAFIKMMSEAKLYDLTQDCSIFTPPWPGEKSLEVHFFKRVTGAYGGGQGANGQILNWSNTVGTHLVGETAFHSGARRIADIPLTDLCGPGVIVDISDMVSDYSIITPEMIQKKADVKQGDILIINTGYHKYSFDQPDVVNPERPGRRGIQGIWFPGSPSRSFHRVLQVGDGDEVESGWRGLRRSRAPHEYPHPPHARESFQAG